MEHRNPSACGRAASGPPARHRTAPGSALVAGAALLLAALALGACRRQAPDVSTIPHTPIPKAEARLAVAVDGDRVRYEGVVADAAAREAVVQALESAAPGATGTIAVEPLTRPAVWLKALGPAVAALRASGGGELDFGGRRIELAGDLTQEQRATLYRRIARLYPGYELAGAFRGADLRHALPDEGDEAALLQFLDATPVEFHAGTGMLSQGGVQGLARMARGLQAAGPAARVQILVHPEAGGDPAAQRALARQRADAILTQLALRGVAPGRVQARVADAPAAKDARLVRFAPFRPGAPAGEDTAGEDRVDEDAAAGEGQAADAQARPTPDTGDAAGADPARSAAEAS